MKAQKGIWNLVDSCRAALRKYHTIHKFSHVVLVVAMLATFSISGVCSCAGDTPKEANLEPNVSYAVDVSPNTSLHMDSKGIPGIVTCGHNLTIYISREQAPSSTNAATSARLYLEAFQSGVDNSENEIIITEWSRVAYEETGTDGSINYLSSNGNGVLKIRKQRKSFYEQGTYFYGTAFQGTAKFNFTDPSIDSMKQNPEKSIDWTF